MAVTMALIVSTTVGSNLLSLSKLLAEIVIVPPPEIKLPD
jgi:hypothetical protein